MKKIFELGFFEKLDLQRPHYAITGKAAAEIIYNEADAKKVFMGLKTWKNLPKGKILKSDVTIAKNYLRNL